MKTDKTKRENKNKLNRCSTVSERISSIYLNWQTKINLKKKQKNINKFRMENVIKKLLFLLIILYIYIYYIYFFLSVFIFI